MEQSVAIEPEALAVRRLDPEIIARVSRLPPPFHGDALGAFGARDLELCPPPTEAAGRAVRHRGENRRDFFRLLQKAQRPARWIAGQALHWPFLLVEISVLRRHGHGCRFRNVGVLRHKTLYPWRRETPPGAGRAGSRSGGGHSHCCRS